MFDISENNPDIFLYLRPQNLNLRRGDHKTPLKQQKVPLLIVR